jgi:predicted TIM-barrel enzyme
LLIAAFKNIFGSICISITISIGISIIITNKAIAAFAYAYFSTGKQFREISGTLSLPFFLLIIEFAPF